MQTLTARGADRLLLALKSKGPQTSAEVGKALGITPEAARQQFQKLASEGLVDAVSEVQGVGRPTQYWNLTREGNARFPDAHAGLAAQLVNDVRSVLGEDALEKLITARETDTRRAYIEELADAKNLADKVDRLAAIRAREGYMAEWREDGDGFVLIENHCPICVAAAACQGFCRAEISVFREVLGAKVERIEHILGGARRCAYRITP